MPCTLGNNEIQNIEIAIVFILQHSSYTPITGMVRLLSGRVLAQERTEMSADGGTGLVTHRSWVQTM